MSLADLVRAALARKDVSIRDAAGRTGDRVSPSQIARICRGESAQIRPQTLQALSGALGMMLARRAFASQTAMPSRSDLVAAVIDPAADGHDQTLVARIKAHLRR